MKSIVMFQSCNLLFVVSLIVPVPFTSAFPPPLQQETFDFVVVGAGTAGSAVASRLTENGKYTVLLLETGKEPDPGLYIPALSRNVSIENEFWKNYLTVPQANAGLENNGIISLCRGETLGGTSAINGMNFNRGSPHDYNQWARMTGDDGWKYSNLLKYFKKMENYAGDFPSHQHGIRGPITVSRPKDAPGLDAWLGAGQELGFLVADPNGPQRISFAPVEFSKKFGRRVTSYTAYIQPVLTSRNNLKIITNARATRIEFKGNRAVGVWFDVSSDGRRPEQRFASANKEVIVSAGVFGSPTLLLKSGIGPKHVLNAAKIPIIKQLPVGQNIHDHVAVRLPFALNNGSAVIDPERDLTPQNFWIFQNFGDGPYSNRDGQVAQAYIASPKAARTQNPKWTDVHLIAYYSTENIEPENTQNLADWEVAMSTIVFNTRPKSRGTLTLNNTDIDGDPLIDIRYLTHPDDMDAMIHGIKIALKVFEQTASHKRLGARYLPSPVPACRHLKYRSDEYWRCFVRQKAAGGFHAAGSCKMGRGVQDPEAVVDPSLRVIGIEGLRVIDASVMPAVTNANTQVPTYVIGERASDMILSSWNRVSPPLRRFTPKIP